jgi:hypothetical protein
LAQHDRHRPEEPESGYSEVAAKPDAASLAAGRDGG